MTNRDMYDALIRGCHYRSDGYYPSTRYDSCHESEYSWLKPNCENYAKIFKENHMNFNNTKILVDGREFKAHNIEVTSDYNGTVITASAQLYPLDCTSFSKTLAERYSTSTSSKPLTIENVIFNPPATIVFWSDHTKTVVKCDTSLEKYDPEKGLAMAISRKMLGDNKREYYNTFLHWLKRYDKQPEEETTTVTVEVDGQEFSRTVTEAVVKEARRSARKSNRGMI